MEQIKNNSQSFLFAAILVVVAAITRFIPHPFNFTAIGAMALFSGANFKNKNYTYLLPISAMFLTDLFIGFHFSILPVYACFAFTVWMGTLIKNNQKLFTIATCSVVSSLVFFLVTNLPLWYLDLRLYPMTIQGTMDSYQMALPFFKNQILGDLLYNGLLFGIYNFVYLKQGRFQTEKNN